MTDKVDCRTPNPDRPGVTRIPKWKYEVVRSVVLGALSDAGGDGLTLADLRDDLRARMGADDLSLLGSLGWHITTVTPSLEVLEEISRVKNSSPQRVILR